MPEVGDRMDDLCPEGAEIKRAVFMRSTKLTKSEMAAPTNENSESMIEGSTFYFPGGYVMNKGMFQPSIV